MFAAFGHAVSGTTTSTLGGSHSGAGRTTSPTRSMMRSRAWSSFARRAFDRTSGFEVRSAPRRSERCAALAQRHWRRTQITSRLRGSLHAERDLATVACRPEVMLHDRVRGACWMIARTRQGALAEIAEGLDSPWVHELGASDDRPHLCHAKSNDSASLFTQDRTRQEGCRPSDFSSAAMPVFTLEVTRSLWKRAARPQVRVRGRG